jgi:hypothetical protein
MFDVMQAYWYQAQFDVTLSEVEYFLDPCTSTQKHICILSIFILLHLLQKGLN